MLSAAAQRDDRCLVPAPKLKGAAAQKIAGKLIAAGLVKEIKAKAGAPVWRRDDEAGISYGLTLTPAGAKAIAIDASGVPGHVGDHGDSGEDVEQTNPSLQLEPSASDPSRNATNKTALRHPSAPRGGTKLAQVVELLQQDRGATINELMGATGWLPHTSRAALTGLRNSGDLAKKLANDFRAVAEARWYRELFPDTRIGQEDSETEIELTARGFRLATSVGGTLTGRGGDLIVIDDPLKPDDAHSETKRNTANEWFKNTLLSRLDDKRTGAIIIVMQRVHMDDLTGFVTSQSDEWEVLTLPAIAEIDEVIPISGTKAHRRRVGEALSPEREPLSVLENLKAQPLPRPRQSRDRRSTASRLGVKRLMDLPMDWTDQWSALGLRAPIAP